ncbi:TPA: radical SAM protein [Candidatus Acetothermia bacterium]|nr:radical SAM protein [Candidatus Acetothermia bacterium]
MIAFGPVPSRRLGRSLGINNIPPKICTYSCVYCQLGRTIKMQADRRAFYQPDEILKDVERKVESTREVDESIDYLTFVPDGEPTLDTNLGHEIELLKPLGIRIAVITNASLIWHEDVREELMKTDWVSLKVDSTLEEVWHRINRPYRTLQLDSVLDGMLAFAKAYEGELATETMLVEGVNDGEENIRGIADFLVRLRPDQAYLSIPTRPPAENWAHPPNEETINRAFQILSEKVDHVEHLIGYEGSEFSFTGNVEEDLLSITAVHPMREDAVSEFLTRAEADWTVVHRLVAQDQLVETEYGGHQFYLRKLRRSSAD